MSVCVSAICTKLYVQSVQRFCVYVCTFMFVIVFVSVTVCVTRSVCASLWSMYELQGIHLHVQSVLCVDFEILPVTSSNELSACTCAYKFAICLRMYSMYVCVCVSTVQCVCVCVCMLLCMCVHEVSKCVCTRACVCVDNLNCMWICLCEPRIQFYAVGHKTTSHFPLPLLSILRLYTSAPPLLKTNNPVTLAIISPNLIQYLWSVFSYLVGHKGQRS